jgi:hypothetical protein
MPTNVVVSVAPTSPAEVANSRWIAGKAGL